MISILTLALVLADAEAPLSLDDIQVTAGRRAQSTFDAESAITVIQPGDAGQRPPAVLSDLLRYRTGVFVQQTTPGQGIPIIRGLKGSEVLHLVDGMRLNNAFFRNAPNQYLALVDPLNVDRVEVVRGPGSTLYGGDAMGGVVQVLTPEPDYDSRVITGYLAADSAHDRLQGHARLSAGGANTAFDINASYSDVGDRRIGGGERLTPSDYIARGVNAKVINRPTASFEWMASLQYLTQPSTPRVDELIPGFGQTEPDSAEFFFEPNTRLFGHLRGRWDLDSPLADQLEIHLARQRMDDDRRTRNFTSTERRVEANRSTLDGLTAQGTKISRSGAVWVWGLEYYSDEVDSRRDEIDIETGIVVPATSRFPDGSTMRSGAIYGHVEHWLSARFRGSAGLRYSSYDIDLPAADRGVGAKLSPDDLTGNVSLLYNATDSVNLIANIGRGFRPPNIFDLGTLGDRPGNRFNIPNPELAPESVVTLDLGLRYAAGDWRAEIFGFISDYDDKIVSVATGDVTETGRTVVQSVNAGSVRLHGFELGFSGQLTSNWDLFGNVTQTHGRETTDGVTQPADRIPPLNGRLGLEHYLRSSLSWQLFSEFAARQDRLSDRDRGDPRIDPNGTPGWATMNLGLSYEPSPALELNLQARNLFDRQYREHASGLDAPGRNFIANITYRWE